MAIRQKNTVKPQVTVSLIHTGLDASMVSNLDFGGGLLKDSRLEREGNGHRLVIHGQHELELFFAGVIREAAKFEAFQLKAAETAAKDETADSVAGVEDVAETKVDVAVAAEVPKEVENAEEDKEEEGGVPFMNHLEAKDHCNQKLTARQIRRLMKKEQLKGKINEPIDR